MMISDPDPTASLLARLQRLYPKAVDLSLDRLRRLLADLGHPEQQLPPVIHIAGTNGKGSTLAMLDAIIQAESLSVQRYISPHLVRFNERILFDGVPIDDRRFSEALSRCEEVNAGREITFFEITTAAAFVAFSKVPADFLLLETGLGGRLDATNVIARPRLTLIAPISLDHQAFLGDTIEQIAAEKAGILKPGTPCILGPQPGAVVSVFLDRARQLDVPLTVHGRDWHAELLGERLKVRVGRHDLDLPRPALRGPHQIENAGLAVAAALALDHVQLSHAAIAEGLQRAVWPARLQRLRKGALAAMLPAGSTLWLDGGHNPAAGRALAAAFDDDDPRPLHLVVGMLSSKDEAGFLRPLAPLARSIHAVPVPGEAAGRDPAQVAATAAAEGIRVTPAPDVEAAMAAITAWGDGPLRVLICGSLYLAGDVLRANS